MAIPRHSPEHSPVFRPERPPMARALHAANRSGRITEHGEMMHFMSGGIADMIRRASK